ncbi:MAG: DUF2974 domain-containing protein, partial [Planctomycetaceae bacterium]|nr:DUF2974 domain-containing protein [Planctomycetaceae bacterium]
TPAEIAARINAALSAIDLSQIKPDVSEILAKNSSEIIELALLAQASYDGLDQDVIGDWVRVKEFLNPNARGDGFRAVLYFNTITKDYVLSFAGTDGLADIKTDIQQGLGYQTSQYTYAAKLAKELQIKYGTKLSFTGHSLGGGLATLAASVTGLYANTFNSAGVHENTFNRNGGKSFLAERMTIAYQLSGDPLTGLQNIIGPMPATNGLTNTIPDLDYYPVCPKNYGDLMDEMVKLGNNHSMVELLKMLGHKGPPLRRVVWTPRIIDSEPINSLLDIRQWIRAIADRAPVPF